MSLDAPRVSPRGASLDAPDAPSTRTRISPVLLAVLGALVVAVIALPLLIVSHTRPAAPRMDRKVSLPPQRVIPKAELPPVEPTAFAAVAPDDARAFNASIPFSKAPLLTAKPFRITGDATSIARATDCLASGVLYEAGDDTGGQRAVAQVILNRVRHPAFPKTVCGVVFQGAERATGCQFTFTCDGSLARRYSEPAWKRAREVAAAALSGSVDGRVGLATHYHTDWVVPYWSASLDKVSAVDTHLFFRWSGWWGTPPAFRGRYAENEPIVAKLVAVAPGHMDGAEATLTAEAALPSDSLPPATTADPNVFLLTLNPRIVPDELADWAVLICGDRPYCKLMAWADRAETPATLPADLSQTARPAFSYLRDRVGGFERALWDCERYKRPRATECMKPRLIAQPRIDAGPGGGLRSALGLPDGPKPELVPQLEGVRRKSDAPARPEPARPGVTPP